MGTDVGLDTIQAFINHQYYQRLMYEMISLGDEAYSGKFGFFFTFMRGNCGRVYNYLQENFFSDIVRKEE